jgi:hypothetical protein
MYVLNLSDKIKILDLLEGNMSLTKVGQYYGEVSQYSTELCILSIQGFS